MNIEDGKLNCDESSSASTQSNSTFPNSNNREIRISNANTDLLFKLFDNIEQKERKQVQLHLQSQYKMHRYFIY